MRKLFTTGVAAVAACAIAGPAAAAPLAAAPVNTGAPAVSGQAYVGKTLTTSKGSWQNGPTAYSYQWARCDGNGNGCVQIDGATSSSYIATSADIGRTLEALVTATNAAGTAGPVSSKPTAAVSPALPPRNTAAPTIVGKPYVGAQLVAEPGSYSGGTVSSYRYDWQRCDPDNLDCTSISGATHEVYTVASADLAMRLRVVVTASNPFGHAATPSNATDAVTVPVAVVTPTLTAARASTICCQTVRLSGTTSPSQAGEKITVLAREYGTLTTATVATTTTDANGDWSAAVTPMIETTYTAQTGTATSTSATVYVHPRVGFGVNGNTFTAKVTGRSNFAGRIAYFQMRTATGGWRRLSLVVINQRSVAKFRLPLRRGHTYALRIFLSRAQAGPGYLAGASEIQRVGGIKK
jgi:hypothetical protein